MPAESGTEGANSSSRGNESTNNNNSGSSSARRRGYRGRGNHTSHVSKFEGKCENLKKSVYAAVVAGKDTFLKTTREIAEHVRSTMTGAGDFRTGMVELMLPPLENPTDPADDAGFVAHENWNDSMMIDDSSHLFYSTVIMKADTRTDGVRSTDRQ